MKRFVQFDVVKLKFGLPEYGIAPGTEAAVLEVYPFGYEIEIDDADGRMRYTGSALDDDLEPLAATP